MRTHQVPGRKVNLTLVCLIINHTARLLCPPKKNEKPSSNGREQAIKLLWSQGLRPFAVCFKVHIRKKLVNGNEFNRVDDDFTGELM